MNMTHPMGSACIGYIPGHPENQMLPYVGQYDLFGALEMELGHADLIRNSWLMQWIMVVQPTLN